MRSGPALNTSSFRSHSASAPRSSRWSAPIGAASSINAPTGRTGAMTVAVTCASIGTFFALFPTLWLHLFTSDEATLRVGTSYLRIVGPIYGLYGLGMGLYFASQGLGNALWTVSANATRVILSSGCALIAIYWLNLGARGLFISIAVGFCAYATLTLFAVWRVKAPPADHSA